MADIQIKSEPENELTLLKVNGSLEFSEVLSLVDTQLKPVVTRHLIWDFLDADISSFTIAEIVKILQKHKDLSHLRKDGKTIMVVKNRSTHEVARLIKSYSVTLEVPIEYHISWSVDDARLLLTSMSD